MASESGHELVDPEPLKGEQVGPVLRMGGVQERDIATHLVDAEAVGPPDLRADAPGDPVIRQDAVAGRAVQPAHLPMNASIALSSIVSREPVPPPRLKS